MNEVQAVAHRMLIAGHRSRIRCIVGLGIGLLIAVLGGIATSPFVFWFGGIFAVISGIMFGRANGRIRQAELEVAKAKQDSLS